MRRTANGAPRLLCRQDRKCAPFAGDELLRNLPLERGAMGTMLGHGLHPLKAQHRWSIDTFLPVHHRGAQSKRGALLRANLQPKTAESEAKARYLAIVVMRVEPY
jgi:hypothetical protein